MSDNGHDEAAAFEALGAGGSWRNLAGVQVEAARWLWDGWLPLGSIACLYAEEGIGKSTLAAWAMARVTTGGLRGEHENQPGNVALLAREDDLASSWVPRLMASGAAMDRISHDEGYGFDLGSDHGAKRLREMVGDTKLRLLYIDQIEDVLGSTNRAETGAMRAAFDRLAKIMREFMAVAVYVVHPNRQATATKHDPEAGFSGNRAIIQVARSRLWFVDSPEQPGEARWLSPWIINAPNRSRHALRFSGQMFDVPNRTGGLTPTFAVTDVSYLPYTHVQVKDAVKRFYGKDKPVTVYGQDVVPPLLEALGDNQPHPYAQVHRHVVGSLGIDTEDPKARENLKRAMSRAGKALGVESTRAGGVAYWRLPAIGEMRLPDMDPPQELH